MENILIYMDCCCLNRPSDDQTQDKIRIESDAILAILFQCLHGSWKLLGSDAIQYEIMKTPDLWKMERTINLYAIKKEDIAINGDIIERARAIQKYGLQAIDSLHYASAEKARASVLLTVDNDFIKNSRRIDSSLRVENPVQWFMEIQNGENE